MLLRISLQSPLRLSASAVLNFLPVWLLSCQHLIQVRKSTGPSMKENSSIQFGSACALLYFWSNSPCCQVMDDSKHSKFETYWDVTLMLCYFWIPFIGMQRALRKYTETDDLPFMSILLLLFISGNIVTWMILFLNEKKLLTKSLWTVVLLVTMIVLNLLVK
jgi:hypothetical protein